MRLRLTCRLVSASASIPTRLRLLSLCLLSMSESNELEGFLLLCKTSSGAQCVMVLQHVLKHPHIFVFGELLDIPSVKQVRDGYLTAAIYSSGSNWRQWQSAASQSPAADLSKRRCYVHCCCDTARVHLRAPSVTQTHVAHRPFLSPPLLSALSCLSLQLADSEHRAWFDLLKVFAYGTYADYKATPGLPELGEAELTKLRQLTLVQMASKQRVSHQSTVAAAVGHARTAVAVAYERHRYAAIAWSIKC